jgi:hypothetical protein
VLRATLAYDRELPWWDLRGSVEMVYSQTEKDIFYVNGNRATGVNALDGRRVLPQHGVRERRPHQHQRGRAPGLVVISRSTRSGFGFNAGYTYMDSENAFDGTSSRAISNWQFHPSQGDIFDDPKATSSWENENRYYVNLFYTFETGRFTHSLGAFYNAESGRPYSVLMGGDPNGDGFSTNDLLYVPSSPDEVILSGFTWDQFQTYLGANGLGTGSRIATAGRPGSASDIHYGIELPISGSTQVQPTWSTP